MSDSTPLASGNDAAAPGPAPARAGRRQLGVSRASLTTGYGTSLNRGFELTLTIVAMVGIGWLVDRVAGTTPLFTIGFAVLGFVGTFVKLWIGYDLEMRQHDEGAIWNRKAEQQEAAS